MRLLCAGIAVAAVLAAPALAENLLANPGFEELSGDKPARWDHFVQPMPGAVAALSDAARSGKYSVWLHTPAPYEKEPVNNWSQNIIAALGGETLRVTGHIRVEDAKEAAIWVQCWRKRPWGVLAAYSTSTDSPVYGTEDWREVVLDAAIPEGTDFITVRCVILGTGSAWFDDIAVRRAGVSGAGTPEEPQRERKDSRATAAVEEPDPKAAETPTPPAPEADGGVLSTVNHLESEVRRLRETNILLTDTLQQMQQVNQALLEEMLAVQAEVRALKAEKDAEAPALDPAQPRVPPLVPLSAPDPEAAP
ncbi:MAG: hypothetical protein KF886_21915 [Candidatus Hydrogenedentes bacterium]|nr:hypothetical protein [Candidatus Hydrogenedentota bacterium]